MGPHGPVRREKPSCTHYTDNFTHLKVPPLPHLVAMQSQIREAEKERGSREEVGGSCNERGRKNGLHQNFQMRLGLWKILKQQYFFLKSDHPIKPGPENFIKTTRNWEAFDPSLPHKPLATFRAVDPINSTSRK